MEAKALQRETITDLTDEDYKSAILVRYRREKNELTQLENDYSNWSHSSQIYALAKTDGSGRPVKANIEAYDKTIVERKKIAIMIKIVKSNINFLENFWVEKGFNLVELKNSIKTKKLQKITNVEKEEVAEDKTEEKIEKKTLTPQKKDDSADMEEESDD